MTQDLRNFPYRVVIHEKHSAQAVLDWLDTNVMSKNWTMGIRNIEIPRAGQPDPIVDMVIYFNRRGDMERFRDKMGWQKHANTRSSYGAGGPPFMRCFTRAPKWLPMKRSKTPSRNNPPSQKPGTYLLAYCPQP